MNSHAMFISLAGFQIDGVSTYPTPIGVLWLEFLHVAPSGPPTGGLTKYGLKRRIMQIAN
jgi:hypothetical protein